MDAKLKKAALAAVVCALLGAYACLAGDDGKEAAGFTVSVQLPDVHLPVDATATGLPEAVTP